MTENEKPAEPGELERARRAIEELTTNAAFPAVSERRRSIIAALIAAERADAARRAVGGMHALHCGCDEKIGIDVDPRCLAARARAEQEASNGK